MLNLKYLALQMPVTGSKPVYGFK